jgi:hypothetical protein
MSEEIEQIEISDYIEPPKSFSDKINIINEKYINIFEELLEKFKYHEDLLPSIEYDLKYIKNAINDDQFNIIDRLTNNFLYCFEQITEHNVDYFTYQKDKVKKDGKSVKNKISKLGNKTVFKRILSEIDHKSINKLFSDIIEIFELLTEKNDDTIIFMNEYIDYVKENFDDNKNFNKMIMVIDNVDDMFSNIPDEKDTKSAIEIEKEKGKNKKDKKSKKSKNPMEGMMEGMMDGAGGEFIKGLETTKIAQLAKNISQKIKQEDFPILSDPAQLLSSLSNNGSNDSGNSIQNLLKFVVGEVEDAFKKENMNEADLVNEAQNIMGKFQNMSGFNPMSMLGGEGKEGDFDFSKIAEIFANIKK